ncbi:MAG: hypothetical protein H6577_28100 [Lewinellaceae bacterium]|nr:hypothetical protein [Lewinellaceae bacterium]
MKIFPLFTLMACFLGSTSLFSQNYSSIVANVDTVYIPGGAPCVLFPTGTAPVTIVAADPATGTFPGAYALASIVGTGRAFAVSHEGLMSNANIYVTDNLKLVSNAVDWLDHTNTNTVKMTSGHTEFVNYGNATNLVTELTNEGYTVSNLTGTIEASDLTGVGVLVIGNAWGMFTAAELTVIQDYLNAGGSLFLLGLGWSWNGNLDDYPMNIVGSMCQVRWTSDVIYDAGHNVGGYPVFVTMYPATQGMSFSGARQVIDSLTNEYSANIGTTLQTNTAVRISYVNAHLYMKAIANKSPLGNALRDSMYNYYTGLANTYPTIFKKGTVYNSNTESYMGWVRERVQRSIRDALPLTTARKAEIATTLNLTGRYLDVWDQASVLLADNSKLDSPQKEYLYELYMYTPTALFDIGSMSFADYIGDQPPGVSSILSGTNYSINSFSDPIGTYPENQFPNDVPDGIAAIFCSASAHEVNHIVDAFYLQNSTVLNTRRLTLLAQAGTPSLNYLRSMLPDGFFANAPQEFIASISNQWYTDSKKTFDLGIIRFDAARPEPLNQALFFAEIYSLGGDTTLFFTNDLNGNFSRSFIPVGRDANGHINSLCVGDTLYTFTLDANGNVTGYTALAVNVTGTINSGTYQAGYQLTSDGNVPAGQDVIFEANHSVDMQANFGVEAGSTFTVNVDPCGG